MKEATSSPYKPIFRETFNDEQSVRKQASSVTAVTFSKGVGSFNGTTSYIKYNKNLNGVYSVRIKSKNLTTSSSCTYVDFRNTSGTGTGYIVGNNLLTLLISSGTAYVNAVATNIVNASSSDIVITGITINCFEIFLNTRYNLTNWLNSDVDLFEIYQGTLTASEVKNLYDNDWNKELVGLNGQTTGNNLLINGTFDTNLDSWTSTRATLTWQPGGFCRLTQNQNETASMAINQSGLTTGKRYLITFDAKAPVITSKPGVSSSHYNDIIAISNPGLSPNWQKYAYEATSKISLLVLYLPTNAVSPGTVVDVDNISVVELQPKLLLDYDSTNGYITDRTGKNTLTPTNVTIKKTGIYYGSEFNGVDSTLVTDSTDPTIWQSGFTVVAWIKPRSWGELNYGRILDVSNNAAGGDGFNFCINNLNSSLFCNINAGGATRSGINSINIGSWQFVVLTVSSNSYINFYKGDIDVAPTLSGLANRTSGLITSITTTNPVTIGNRSTATDSTFDGNIPMLKVYKGVLSLEELTQIWSSTRGKIQ